MAKRNGPSERARTWAKKWANFNHGANDKDLPEPVGDEERHARAYQSALWIGFFTGGMKGWYSGYKAGRASAGKETAK